MSNSDQFSPRHLDGDGLLKQSAGANPIARPDEVAGDLPEIISGTTPLVTAANPILNLIPQLRATAQHPDPAGLRDQFELGQFLNQLAIEVRTFTDQHEHIGIA